MGPLVGARLGFDRLGRRAGGGRRSSRRAGARPPGDRAHHWPARRRPTGRTRRPDYGAPATAGVTLRLKRARGVAKPAGHLSRQPNPGHAASIGMSGTARSLVPFACCRGLAADARLRIRPSTRSSDWRRAKGERPSSWPCRSRSSPRNPTPFIWRLTGSSAAPSAGSSTSRSVASGCTTSSASTPTARSRSRSVTSRPRRRSATPARRRTSSDPTRTGRRAPAVRPAVRANASARRSVSRVLSRPPHGRTGMAIHLGPPVARRLMRPTRGLGSAPLPADGCPPAGCALLFGLAPGGVCPFHSVDRRLAPDRRHRHCGTGPRLTAGGRYPPPCAAELGLSSRLPTGRPKTAGATIRPPR